MISRATGELVALGEAFASMRQAFFERAREVALQHGIELLEIAPVAGGAWDLRVRWVGAAVAEPAPRNARFRGMPFGAPDPPFVSPVPDSEPFRGDGSSDFMGLLAAADTSVCVTPWPASGGGDTPWLSDVERLDLLPVAIVGDAMLSLQHRGLHENPGEVANALAHGRALYEGEVVRVFGDDHVAERMMLFDAAAADAGRQLQRSA